MASTGKKLGRNPFDQKSYKKTSAPKIKTASRTRTSTRSKKKSNLIARLRTILRDFINTMRMYVRHRRYA